MFPGVGTVINVAAIAIGSSLGVIVGGRITSKSQKMITDILGLVTLLGAVGALFALWSPVFTVNFPKGSPLLLILATLLIGGLMGTALNLENRLDTFGEHLRKRFKASHESPFVEGFVSASLLFVIGPLAILGSVSDGMSTGIDQLLLKSSLDFFASLAFASSLGWGVAASIIPVAIYQGAWTVIGLGLGEVLSQYQIDAMTITGGVLLVCIGLRLLDIKKVAVGNLLPALFIAPLMASLVHLFN